MSKSHYFNLTEDLLQPLDVLVDWIAHSETKIDPNTYTMQQNIFVLFNLFYLTLFNFLFNLYYTCLK